MNKYKLVLKVKDLGFNGVQLTSDVEVIIHATDENHAREKAQRSAEYYARYAGKNMPAPAFTLEEIG